MKHIATVLAFALIAASASLFACDCGKSASAPATPAAEKPAVKKHPLKGVVTDLLPTESALMVRHEEVPGVMKAMTMMLVVDPAVLNTVKKNDAITGLLYRDAEGVWRLDEVKVVTPAS